MIASKKALRIITYILLSVVGMLFFAYILTYDFTSKKAYTNELSLVEMNESAIREITSSIETNSDINFMSLKLSNKFINEYVSSFYGNQDNIYESEYWSINGVKIDLRDNQAIATFFTTFNKGINYKLKIRVFFDVYEDKESFNFSLSRIKVGAFAIPKNTIQSIISNKDENSIGAITTRAIQELPFGKYNSKNISISIDKKEIADSIEDGFLGELLFLDDDFIKTIYSKILNLYFSQNIISLQIDDGIKVTVDYSKSINSNSKINFTSEVNELLSRKSTGYMEGLYNLAFDSIIGIEKEPLDQYLLTSIVQSEFNENNELKYVYSNGINYQNVYSVLSGNTLKLGIILEFIGKTSVIEYTFSYNGVKYQLSKIENGKDVGEEEYSYLIIDNTDNKQGFLSLLNKCGIETDLISETINIKSALMKKLNIQDVNFDSGIEVVYKESDSILSKIQDVIYNRSLFWDNSSTSFSDSIKSQIDTSSSDSLKSSFAGLSMNDKKIILNAIRDYFKDDISVYNYIDALYN